MRRYDIVVNVTDVVGTQMFRVTAASKKLALEAFKEGKGEFISEELEVQSFDDPELDDIHEVEEG